MTNNHPNRSKYRYTAPTPDEIRRVRVAAGLTQTAAARLISSTITAFARWEAPKLLDGQPNPLARHLHPGLWELFQIKCKNLRGEE